MKYAIALTDIAKQMLKEQVLVNVIGTGIRKEGSKDDIYERLQKLFRRF